MSSDRVERGAPATGASYARFSSELQSNESLDSQQRLCRERAERDGVRILPGLEFADSAVSGTKRQREGLDAMLQAAADGRFSVLYLHSLSRFGRETAIMVPLLKQLVRIHNVRVVSISEGVDSAMTSWNLLSTMLSVQHERYIDELSANVFRGQEEALRNGFSVGDFCFGYSSVPIPGSDERRRGRHAKPHMRYEVDEGNAEWVRRVFRWFVAERRSLRWITKELNRQGAPKDHRSITPSWHHTYVARLLANAKYVGVWPWGRRRNVRNPLTGQVAQEARPDDETDKWVRQFPDLRIIDDETFAAAQRLLQENRERSGRRRQQEGPRRWSHGAGDGAPRHLLSGLVRCAECGTRFQVGGAGGKYLKCPLSANGKCSCRTTLPRERAERMILDAVGTRILANPTWRQTLLELVRMTWTERERRVPSELSAAEKRLADVDRRIERLLNAVEEGAVDSGLGRRLADRRTERSELARTVETLRRADENRPPPPTAEWIDERLAMLGATLSESTPAAAYALRDLVGGEITVTEIRREDRKRHHLRGEFRIVCGSLMAAVATQHDHDEDALGDANDAVEAIVIDFVEPKQVDEQSEQAKALYDDGLLNVAIAERLQCTKSYVTKLLKHWFTMRGLEMPDGRGRRKCLDQKQSENPSYQRVADRAKGLYDEGKLLKEIAAEIGCDRATITKALDFWHESHGQQRPDGRTRRKDLAHDSSSS